MPSIPTSSHTPHPNPTNTHEEQPSSWTDTLHTAFTSCSGCIPCLRKIPSDDSLHNHDHSSSSPLAGQGQQPGLYANTINTVPRARPDELEGLLTASSSFSSTAGWSDNEDDRFSLHTNPGTNPRKRKAKKKHSGKITLFGFNLFGRRDQEGRVKLDEENGDDALYRDTSTSALAAPQPEEEPYTDEPPAQSKTPKGKGKRTKFDADAAPISSARIAELAASASASASSSPRLSQRNPLSPPDSPSSTFPIPPSRASDDDGFNLGDTPAPSTRSGGHNRTHSSYLFSSSPPGQDAPLSPTEGSPSDQPTTKSASKKKKGKSSKNPDKHLIKTQLAHLERLKAQGTLPESNGGVEFEGFQGSGSAVPSLPHGIVARRSVGTRSTSSGGSSSSRSKSSTGRVRTGTTGPTSPSSSSASPFSSIPPPVVTTPSAFEADQDEEDEADLDGAMYSGPRRKGYVPGGGSSSGSRSHGRSESRSQPGHHARSDSRSSSGHPAQYAAYPTSPGFSGAPSPLGFGVHQDRGLEDIPSKKPSSKRKSKSGTSSSGTRSNRSNSVVASPLSPSFHPDDVDSTALPKQDQFPSTGLGKSGSAFPSTGLGSAFPSAGLGKSSSFPSAGIGKMAKPPNQGLRASDMARMLRREEGDEFEGF